MLQKYTEIQKDSTYTLCACFLILGSELKTQKQKLEVLVDIFKCALCKKDTRKTPQNSKIQRKSSDYQKIGKLRCIYVNEKC